jgi:hypothetical protein
VPQDLRRALAVVEAGEERSVVLEDLDALRKEVRRPLEAAEGFGVPAQVLLRAGQLGPVDRRRRVDGGGGGELAEGQFLGVAEPERAPVRVTVQGVRGILPPLRSSGIAPWASPAVKEDAALLERLRSFLLQRWCRLSGESLGT